MEILGNKTGDAFHFQCTATEVLYYKNNGYSVSMLLAKELKVRSAGRQHFPSCCSHTPIPSVSNSPTPLPPLNSQFNP